jgi:hypothetical protein
MALSIIQQPEYVNTAFNPIPFTFNSTNTAQENFRYVCQLYDCSSNLLTTVTQPAYPNIGVGVFNLQKICSAYVQSLEPSKLYTTLYKNREQACFTAKFAESYTAYYICTGVNIDLSPVDGYNLQFFFVNNHSFQVGDVISFSGTGEIGDLYNNTWTVIATPSVTTINVNGLNLGTTNSGTTATCVLASHQRTTFPTVNSADTEFWAYNAAISDLCEYPIKLSDYDISVGSGGWPVPWFSDVPQPYPIRITNYCDMNCIYDVRNYPTNTPNAILVQVIDDSGNTFTYTSVNIPDTSWSGATEFFVPMGPKNLNLANTQANFTAAGLATFPMIKPSSVSYCVWLRNGISQATEKMCFELDNSCSKYDNFELNFMDRKGNYVPFNFTLVQRKNVGINRVNYKRGGGTVALNSGLSFDCDNRGTVSLNNIITYNYTLQSDWLSNDMSIYFEELLTSPNVYWNVDGSGTFIPITLTTNTTEILTKKNSRLIAYQIQFTQSNNPIVQQGG